MIEVDVDGPAYNDLPLPTSYLVSILLETAFWGIYVVLFGICLWILIGRSVDGKLNKPMLISACILFLLSTMHLAVGWSRLCLAFLDNAREPEGARIYLESAGNPLNILSETIYGSNNIFADAMLIYRCWVVYECNLTVVLVPIVVLSVSSLCAIFTIYHISINGPAGTIFATAVRQWATAYFSLSLATNVVVTLLIAYRIYRVSQKAHDLLASHRSKGYLTIIAIIVESGCIYVVVMLCTVVLFVNGYYAKLIPFDILGQVMGIVPTLIIVRVGLGQSIEHTYSEPPVSSTRTNIRHSIQTVNPPPSDDDSGRKVSFVPKISSFKSPKHTKRRIKNASLELHLSRSLSGRLGVIEVEKNDGSLDDLSAERMERLKVMADEMDIFEEPFQR